MNRTVLWNTRKACGLERGASSNQAGRGVPRVPLPTPVTPSASGPTSGTVPIMTTYAKQACQVGRPTRSRAGDRPAPAARHAP